MWKHVYFLIWLSLSTVLCADLKPKTPENIVQNHIKNNLNFSVDPCDDFYAHVCPKTVKNHFLFGLTDLRNGIVKDYKASYPDKNWREFEDIRTKVLGKKVFEFINSGGLKSLCAHNVTMVSLLFEFLSGGSKDPLNQLGESSCEEKIKNIESISDLEFKFINSRYMLKGASDSSIANLQLKKVDQKVRTLFKKLKLAVLKQLKKTPWAIENGSVEKFSEVLEKIEFTTFDDIRGTSQNALKAFDMSRIECRKSLKGKLSNDHLSAICEMIAVGEGVRIINEPSDKIKNQDKQGILEDRLQQWNSDDSRVYVGNDFMILGNTEYLSDLYGTVGFSLVHEIMHSLVFDHRDELAQNPLVPLWTKDAKCVEEQTQKTCETFPTLMSMDDSDTVCDSKTTFEEDAADLAAYRIVYDVYRRAYTRKTTIPNYESLDNKQLFFYGAAVLFCQPRGMELTLSIGNDHSNDYQRVNSLMSQMDEFAEVFKCKPTDRMMKNRGRHCELYGAKAERKNSATL